MDTGKKAGDWHRRFFHIALKGSHFKKPEKVKIAGKSVSKRFKVNNEIVKFQTCWYHNKREIDSSDFWDSF